jgi:hypothetical protein
VGFCNNQDATEALNYYITILLLSGYGYEGPRHIDQIASSDAAGHIVTRGTAFADMGTRPS